MRGADIWSEDPIKRRDLLFGLTGGAAFLAMAGTGALTLRLHRSPERLPFLSDAHLQSLLAAEIPAPRVLFVGNSMVLNHDLPKLVAGLAAKDGVELNVATAAASGARLIETIRIDLFRELLVQVPWDVAVLQDFTKTPLRAPDRWGSAFAVRRAAGLLGETPIVLYPPFPASAGQSVYASAGRFSTTPRDPADYARRTMVHYSGMADAHGLKVAPVPERWLEAAGPGFYASDGHHPSKAGSEFVASVLWPVIKAFLPDGS